VRVIALHLALIGLGCLAAGCDQSGSHGHMMGSGMMGGGMMGQMVPNGSGQPLPEPQSEEAQLFQRYCGQCHATPTTTAHSAREWPQVVDRMKQYMVTQGKAVNSSDQLQKIVDYLQLHAG